MLFLIFIIILLLPLATGLGGFPYPSAQAKYSDFTISHYPNAVYLQRAFSNAELPLWSSSILSGYPFFASPLAGVWYLPGWLALVFPLPLGLNLLVLLHIFSGGIGQYQLAKQQGISPLASALAGIAFAGMPKIVAHLGAGHISLIYAVCWTPWLLFFSSRNTRTAHWGTPITLALITLADPRWLPYAAGCWWWYEIFIHDGGRISFKQIKRLVSQSAVGLLLAGPLLIPLWEYARLSSRSIMTASDVLAYSLPWDRLLGLVYPLPGGFHEWMLYPGAVVLALALCAPWIAPDRTTLAKVRGWGFLVIISLVWSLGEHLPGLAQVARLPVLGWMRVPPRALFLAGIGLGIMAAYALQVVIQGVMESKLARLRLLFIALLAATMGVGTGAQMLAGKLVIPFLWGSLGAGLAGFLILFIIYRRAYSTGWIVGLLLFTLLDLGAFGKTLVVWRNPAQVLSENAVLAEAILSNSQEDSPGAFRIYSPSYSLPQQTAIHYQFELADGIEPLQWQPYVAYMAEATGVPAAGYSVTLPAYAGGQTASANRSYQPDADRLGLLGVRYIASEFDLRADGLDRIATLGETRLYENRFVQPRAWVQLEAGKFSAAIRPAEILLYQANRIDVRAVGPGRLIMAELAYPGWQVRVDGKEETLFAYQGIFRSVELSEGEHQIRFVFRPLSLIIGLGLFISGLVILAFNPERFRGVIHP
jgi:hypothetical protein